MLSTALLGALALVSPATALQGLPIRMSELAKQVTDRSAVPTSTTSRAAYPEYNLSVPIDHFHNDSKYEPHADGSFNLRYWFDAQFYEPGGPVFVLSGGETDGEDRIPFLEKGIVYEVAKAQKGLGVILEHRYYGKSVPVDDFSTEELRFLTTEQALADTAYFAQNVVFEGLEDVDLTASAVPWIAYGGSYAGAFVAFLRVVYPDVFFGAISSSGVPKAIWDYWEYFEAARVFAPEPCSDVTGKVTYIVDNILLNETNYQYAGQVKELFGASASQPDKQFASGIIGGIYSLQSYNWDPAISGDDFFVYCDIVSNDTLLYPSLESKRESLEELATLAGFGDELDTLSNQALNYIGYILIGSPGATELRPEAEVFETYDTDFLAQKDITQTWRLWPYQVCTEWGYLQTGSGAPADILPMISRLNDLESAAEMCVDAFGITEPANVDAINKYGGFDIAYDRLAFLDGEWDPWRAAGVQAMPLPPRESTVSQPVILIDDAVHHWDENGVTPDEGTVVPPAVKDAKADIQDFLTAWLKEWEGPSS